MVRWGRVMAMTCGASAKGAGIMAATAAVLLASYGPVAAGSGEGEIGPARRAELLHLLEQDCGSCHGLTRKGGLGAPLLPETLEGRSDEFLTGVILDGIPGTPMPPWRPLLTPGEARWLVQTLRRGRDAP